MLLPPHTHTSNFALQFPGFHHVVLVDYGGKKTKLAAWDGLSLRLSSLGTVTRTVRSMSKPMTRNVLKAVEVCGTSVTAAGRTVKNVVRSIL